MEDSELCTCFVVDGGGGDLKIKKKSQNVLKIKNIINNK